MGLAPHLAKAAKYRKRHSLFFHILQGSQIPSLAQEKSHERT